MNKNDLLKINIQRINFEYLISIFSSLYFLSYYFALPLIASDKKSISFQYPVIIVSTITILFLPYLTAKLKFVPKKYFFESNKKENISFFIIILSFILFSIYFSFFSWGEGVGLLYSISSLFRIIWLFYATQISFKTKRIYIIIYIILTIILGFIDTQRTIILLCLLVAISKLRLSFFSYLISFSAAFFSLCSIAAIRDNQGFNILGNVIYAFAGESYLATLSYVEAFDNINFSLSQNIYHFFYLFSSPLLYLINKLVFYLPLELDREYLFPDLFQDYFGEYNLLGGHFIGSTFLPFGQYQIIFLPLYFIFAYTITRRLIGPLSVPLSSVFFILSIKNTPFLYWNLVFIILFASNFFKFLRKIKWR